MSGVVVQSKDDPHYLSHPWQCLRRWRLDIKFGPDLAYVIGGYGMRTGC